MLDLMFCINFYVKTTTTKKKLNLSKPQLSSFKETLMENKQVNSWEGVALIRDKKL